MGKFQVKAAGKGLVFNLLATNGQVVATSEVYNKISYWPFSMSVASRIVSIGSVAINGVIVNEKKSMYSRRFMVAVLLAVLQLGSRVRPFVSCRVPRIVLLDIYIGRLRLALIRCCVRGSEWPVCSSLVALPF